MFLACRFEDDEERPTSRHSTPGGRRRGGSYLDDVLDKDDGDWLDMAAGASAKLTRPSSEGGIPRETSEKPKQTNAPSEPVDWLGLSRLGSPERKSNEDLTDDATLTDSKQPLKSALKTPPPKDERSTRSKSNKTEKQADDWLGLGESAGSDGEDDWLTPKVKPTPTRETPGRINAPKDPPGVKQPAKDSEPTPQERRPSLGRQNSKNDDWLGFGSEKDDDPKNDSMFR